MREVIRQSYDLRHCLILCITEFQVWKSHLLELWQGLPELHLGSTYRECSPALHQLDRLCKWVEPIIVLLQPSRDQAPIQMFVYIEKRFPALATMLRFENGSDAFRL